MHREHDSDFEILNILTHVNKKHLIRSINYKHTLVQQKIRSHLDSLVRTITLRHSTVSHKKSKSVRATNSNKIQFKYIFLGKVKE